MDGPTLVGRTIGGRYAIDALVGEGAMGAVYRASQIVLGTTVAVKVLHRPLHADPTFTSRFLEEARAASRINHPGSVRVLDFGEEPDGLLYIVMEYLDGRPLDQVLAAEGPLPSPRIVDIASQILAALAVAHEMGIIHRDLKPENIVLRAGTNDEGKPCDVVKVCDFGVAKQIEPLANHARVTGDGIVIGTPAYMSPEQARGDVLDPTSDLYAVGVLIFQLMTGKLPFDGATPMGTALMHVTEEPTRPRLLNPSADERLEAICLKAMRKRASERPASAREMRAELRALLAEDASDTSPEPLPSLMEQVRPRARRGGMVVAGSLLVATTLAGIVAYGRQKASVAEASELVTNAPAVAPSPEPVRAASPAVSVAMANTATPPDLRAVAPSTSAASTTTSRESTPAAVDPERALEDEAAAKPHASSASAEPVQRRSAQRRGVARGHVRRHDKAPAPADPSLQELPRPALPSPDESPRAAAPSPAELSKSPDAAPKEAPVNAKTREPSAEPDPLPLPVFPDPPPPEADPFDAPR